MATPRDQTIQLTSLFQNSTSHLLAYTIPLLLLSLLLTFAGTFFTLDRTRSFAPRSDVAPALPGSFETPKSVVGRVEGKLALLKFRLDGGIGGLAIGYIFGLHASTFLALLIMNESNSSPLSSTTFLVVWVFSVALTTALGGRWKFIALLFAGITGGITISLALSVITHPSLFSRVVLASVATPLVTLAVMVTCLVPSPALSNAAHATARMATSCAGAFSTTMAVALLTRSTDYQSWANVWDRLWVADGLGWGTSKERGFDAIFCVLWISGAICDWSLRRWIGEDPDERWDSYLAEYTSSFPNVHGRAGNFRPLPSRWNRILEALHLSSSPSEGPMVAKPFDMLFPSDAELALKPSYLPVPGGDGDDKTGFLPAYDDATHGRPRTSLSHDWTPPPTSAAGRLIKNKSRTRFGIANPEDSDETVYDLARRPTYLKKPKSAKVQQRTRKLTIESGGRRAPVRFRPQDGFSSSDESSGEEDEELRTPDSSPAKAVRLQTVPVVRSNSDATSLSGTTVHPSGSEGASAEAAAVADTQDIDIEKERARLTTLKSTFGAGPALRPGDRPGAPEYSDVEEDVTNAYTYARPPPARDEPGWKPAFLKRAASASVSASASSASSSSRRGKNPERDRMLPPPGAVPMTPSLVNALGRIAQAQAQAYANVPGSGSSAGANVSAGAGPAKREHSDGLPTEGYPAHPLRRASPADHVAIAMDAPPRIPGLPFARDDDRPLVRGAGRSGDALADGAVGVGVTVGEEDRWDEFWRDVQAKAVEVDAR